MAKSNALLCTIIIILTITNLVCIWEINDLQIALKKTKSITLEIANEYEFQLDKLERLEEAYNKLYKEKDKTCWTAEKWFSKSK